jgi:signal transduction histidine kinase
LATLTKAQGQSLTLQVSQDLPLVLCDGRRAAQVAGNLVGNAIKYTPCEGRIVVGLGRSPEDGFLLLSVQDTGVGIHAAEQAAVFDRFFRSRSAQGINGTGLGLHIARWLVELHGGRIWLESDVERGSTFYVTFPLADVTSG